MSKNLLLVTLSDMGYSAAIAILISGVLLAIMQQIKKICNNFLMNRAAR